MTLARALLLAVPVVAACDGASSGDCSVPDVDAAPTITDEAGTGAFPASDAAGGTITSGTWYETAHVTWDGAGGDARHGVLVFDADGATFGSVEGEIGSDPGVFLGTWTTAGTTLTLTGGCGQSGSLELGFTATDDTLTIYNAQDQNVTTYTLQ
jgi:hypothetical protein